MKVKHYDGTKLLSMKDLDGNKPEFYMVTSNRSDGKTTYFERWLTKRFKEHKEQFMNVVRFKDQLSNISKTFFSGIQDLFFPDDIMTHKVKDNGLYAELYLNDELCGYAVALNTQSKLKTNSSLFNNIKRIWMDEYQTLDRYCTDEVRKIIDLHYTVARGKGESYRYVPIFLTGNHLDFFNPYNVELGICGRLKADTHFLRGHGWILEQNINQSVLEARQLSGLTKAFQSNAHIARDAYLYDELVIMEKPKGMARYLMTIKYQGKEYGLFDYGYCAYFTTATDESFKVRAAVLPDDIDDMTPHINFYQFYSSYISKMLRAGLFRFKNAECKKICFDIFYKLH